MRIYIVASHLNRLNEAILIDAILYSLIESKDNTNLHQILQFLAMIYMYPDRQN